MGKTVDEILSHTDTNETVNVITALLHRIGKKLETRGEGQLTETERRLLSVNSVEGQVSNGGFEQYFSNSQGNRAVTARADLAAIGAGPAAELLRRAMAVFPGGNPETDQRKREKTMEQIAARAEPIWRQCDIEFYSLKESVTDLSLAYARKNRTDIILP